MRGGLLGHVDDNYIGPPAAPKPAEVAGKARYKAGYQADPGKIGAELNFKAQPPGGYAMVQPSRLPRDLAAVQARMGKLDLAPDSMTEAPWNMSEAESAPYSPEANAAIPVGTVIPGVIIKGEGAYEGDRGDLEAGAIWADGHWMLEVRRALDTGSSFDTALRPGEPVYLWVGVFDHSQTRHSRHIRPIALKLVPPSTS